MRVLLVEDEPALADVIARNLRARHHDVAIAASVEAALLEMSQTWPDAMILDVNLPDRTGWDILRRLTAADRQKLSVIVVSAAPISEKRMEEFKPHHTLRKPFPIDALMRALPEASSSAMDEIVVVHSDESILTQLAMALIGTRYKVTAVEPIDALQTAYRVVQRQPEAMIVSLDGRENVAEIRDLLAASPRTRFVFLVPEMPPRAALARLVNEHGSAIIDGDERPVVVVSTLVAVLERRRMIDTPTDPNALPARVKGKEREQSGRGTLRIYLGAFAGIGKTYAMLNEAQRRRKYGEDVIVGVVETHHRTQTEAMVDGLEVIPRKRVDYRGIAIEEMDVDAILRRHPAVCLVDELAHTNALGSERAKRYEDIELLLDSAINVVSTLNVQHLESLNDTVESITGVRVRETIPDSVVDDTDELILIDLSPEAARARMEHGHIYPPAQAQAALQSFFRPENLAALREIALRRTAHEVDEQLDRYMRQLTHRRAADEHVLVLVDEKPLSRTLIRRAWRIAAGLHADLIVAYVKRDVSEETKRELARTLELAEDLNARVVPLQGEEVRQALTSCINAEGVNHVVLSHRKRARIERMLKRSLADQLMLASTNLDVHFVSAAE